MKNGLPVLFVVLLLVAAACSSTKTLSEGQYMLDKNNVEVKDEKGPQFDNLKSYVRPIPNKKFLDLINLRTMAYTGGQPKYDKKGNLKDSKFKKRLREKWGESPVLLDSTEISNSMRQLSMVMGQLGYFDASISFDVIHNKKDFKKVKVNYLILANEAYHISKINYDIDIPEYRKIIILNKEESLLNEGMRYDEDIINQEFTRIINLLRDEGYYYVEKSLINAEVSYDMPTDSLQTDPKSVTLNIQVKIPEGSDASRYLYKYYFNNTYVQTNFDPNTPADQTYDTVRYVNLHKGSDCYFVTPHDDELSEPIKDYTYKTIANAIFTKRGEAFSQRARRVSSQALNRLDNFSYFNISFLEDLSKLDTLNKIGYLDAVYRLTRKKVHSVGGQIDLRNDKSAISFSYTNRNIFKGAENLTINLSAGYFYYSLSNLFHNNRSYAYPEFGVNASLDFPKLFLFSKYQNPEALKYSTTLKFGVNYSGLYRRLIYNTSLTYNWTPNRIVSHSVSPIDISTINNDDKRFANILNYDDYPESYQNRFGKFFLLSLKYNLNLLVPLEVTNFRHNMRLSANFESSGLLLKGLNRLISPNERWVLSRNSLDSSGYNYTSFEKLEFTWLYSFKINANNTFSTRMTAGAIIPLDDESYMPYERGFYMGTSNSMRGWGYRGVGPGSYEHGRDSLFTGDIKLELNFEYRGTIYRTLKYGIFADVGNIWLSRECADMPGAEFKFKRFYRELAFDAGIGIRIDLDFLVLRVDYAIPFYDPTRGSVGKWINSRWLEGRHAIHWGEGLKIAIGYAF